MCYYQNTKRLPHPTCFVTRKGPRSNIQRLTYVCICWDVPPPTLCQMPLLNIYFIYNANTQPKPSQTCSGGFIKTQLYAASCCFCVQLGSAIRCNSIQYVFVCIVMRLQVFILSLRLYVICDIHLYLKKLPHSGRQRGPRCSLMQEPLPIWL